MSQPTFAPLQPRQRLVVISDGSLGVFITLQHLLWLLDNPPLNAH